MYVMLSDILQMALPRESRWWRKVRQTARLEFRWEFIIFAIFWSLAVYELECIIEWIVVRIQLFNFFSYCSRWLSDIFKYFLKSIFKIACITFSQIIKSLHLLLGMKICGIIAFARTTSVILLSREFSSARHRLPSRLYNACGPSK